MFSSIAGEIILIFSLMFIAITIAGLWFAFSASKLKHKKELQEKKIGHYRQTFQQNHINPRLQVNNRPRS